MVISLFFDHALIHTRFRYTCFHFSVGICSRSRLRCHLGPVGWFAGHQLTGCVCHALTVPCLICDTCICGHVRYLLYLNNKAIICFTYFSILDMFWNNFGNYINMQSSSSDEISVYAHIISVIPGLFTGYGFVPTLSQSYHMRP